MPYSLAYALPRAVIVLGLWGAAYFVLTALSTRLAPAVIYMTGVAWVMAGVVCFGYLYRLRRALGLLPHQLAAAAAAAAARATAPIEPRVIEPRVIEPRPIEAKPARRQAVPPQAPRQPKARPVPVFARLRALSAAR